MKVATTHSENEAYPITALLSIASQNKCLEQCTQLLHFQWFFTEQCLMLGLKINSSNEPSFLRLCKWHYLLCFVTVLINLYCQHSHWNQHWFRVSYYQDFSVIVSVLVSCIIKTFWGFLSSPSSSHFEYVLLELNCLELGMISKILILSKFHCAAWVHPRLEVWWTRTQTGLLCKQDVLAWSLGCQILIQMEQFFQAYTYCCCNTAEFILMTTEKTLHRLSMPIVRVITKS